MAKLNWTSEAERWLKDIYDYIAADNPCAAADVVNGIYAKAQAAAAFKDDGLSEDEVSRMIDQAIEKSMDPPKQEAPTAPSKSKKKIGRNDPCPCGSGKKHKKFCLIV